MTIPGDNNREDEEANIKLQYLIKIIKSIENKKYNINTTTNSTNSNNNSASPTNNGVSVSGSGSVSGTKNTTTPTPMETITFDEVVRYRHVY